jgi:CheY-like chemotaxis protein
VLIIEDNQDLRSMYRIILEMDGHEVLEAGDARRGLQLLKKERPDVALVDIGLQGMDGHDLARQFRGEPGGDTTLLIALTGYGSRADRERSRQAGFDHHLVKPVDPETLAKLLIGKKKAS